VHVWCTVPKDWNTGYNRSVQVKFFTSPKKIIVVKEKRKEKEKAILWGSHYLLQKKTKEWRRLCRRLAFPSALLSVSLSCSMRLGMVWYGDEFSHSFMTMLFQIVYFQFTISVLFCTIWVS
jgi:hypothetical protein